MSVDEILALMGTSGPASSAVDSILNLATPQVKGVWRGKRFVSGTQIIPAGRPLTKGLANVKRAELNRKVVAVGDYFGANPDGLRIVDLFHGVGGAALGTIEACKKVGVPTVHVGVQRQSQQVAIAELNGLQVVEMDVGLLGGARPINIFLLRGGPPCQPFSKAGRGKGMKDARDGFKLITRALDQFSPKRILLENVAGILAPKHRDAISYIKRTILGRFPHSGVWVLQARQFGSPSDRERVYFWGADIPLIEPTPTHGPGTGRPFNSVRRVLELSRAEARRFRASMTLQGKAVSRPIDQPSHAITTGGNFYLVDKPGRKYTGAGSVPPQARQILRARQVARLMGFPKSFKWGETTSKKIHEMVGNSEPPALAAAVTRAAMRGYESKLSAEQRRAMGLSPAEMVDALSLHHDVWVLDDRRYTDRALTGVQVDPFHDDGRRSPKGKARKSSGLSYVAVYSAAKLADAFYARAVAHIRAQHKAMGMQIDPQTVREQAGERLVASSWDMGGTWFPIDQPRTPLVVPFRTLKDLGINESVSRAGMMGIYMAMAEEIAQSEGAEWDSNEVSDLLLDVLASNGENVFVAILTG